MSTRAIAPDLSPLRAAFPSLQRAIAGRPCVFADAPGGTQVPDSVVEAMARYLRASNANSGGAFATSEETDELIASARRAGAALLGCDPTEIVFGPNMTSLAFALSRSLAPELAPGDGVVVTRLDHDANVAPWVAAAEDAGASVRWVDIDDSDCTLDLGSLDLALSEPTRVVAFTLASNAVGTVTAATEIVHRARRAGALVIADAVHLAPHQSIDARALDVDVLFCSPYKFFGPHMGVMFGRRELLDRLRPYKVRPSHDESPDRWETGTKNHEALSGFVAALDYLASIGQAGDSPASGADIVSAVDATRRAGRDLRTDLVAGMDAVRRAEAALSTSFLDGLESIPSARLYGIWERTRVDERTPTFALRIGDDHPRWLAEELGRRGIFTWDGNYYALELMKRLGLEESGGALRIGFCHINTIEEIDRVLDELRRLG
jgi:cysteine desulfurase family protein (TIGR01976 family)